MEWVIIMNYLVSSTYNINYYEYNDLELNFMKKTYEIGMSYPFKWYEFINKIIGNHKTTYFKDTTMIVTLIELELGQVKILFEILKEYLKLKLIKKILYKREFIIVHFHTLKTKEVFEQTNFWQSVFCYFTIKEYYPSLDVNLRGVINQNNHKELVDLIINTTNEIYLINSTTPLLDSYPDTKKAMIVYDMPRNMRIPSDNKIIKFSFDVSTLLFNFERVIDYVDTLVHLDNK